MTKEFKEYLKTADLTTLKGIKIAFSHCTSDVDADELTFLLSPSFGTFELVQADDESFTITRTYLASGDEKFKRDVWTFDFAEAPNYPFYIEMTGTFKKTFRVIAKSEDEAIEKIENAFKNRDIEFDGTESHFDTSYKDISDEYSFDSDPITSYRPEEEVKTF